MKTLFVLSLIFVLLAGSSQLFSQTGTSYKTQKIFSLSYQNYDSKIKALEDVNITSVDTNAISIEEVIYGPTSSQNKYISHTIIYNKIKSFGYKVNPSPGKVVGYGAMGGFTVGFILGFGVGTIASDGPKPSIGQRIAFGAILGLLGALPGALIGSLTVTDIREYKKIDISKYSSKKKYDLIQSLIATGNKVNKE